MTYSTSARGPEDLRVGVANPFALAEALLGRVINQNSSSVTRLLSDVMQCEYQELFDMKFNSVLYAGWKLNTKNNTAEPVDGKDIRMLEEKDLETPDMSKYKKISDLREAIKDIDQAPIRDIQLRNGYLHLLLKPNDLGRRISNSAVTMTVFELCLPFRHGKEKWQPAKSTWRDMHHLLQQAAMAHEMLCHKEESKEERNEMK